MPTHILVGSTSGNTEFLAQELSDALEADGHTVIFHDQPDYQEVPQTDCCWLLCIATHGAGDYADSIIEFMHAIAHHQPDLSKVKAAIVAVGDSSYDTYCKAGDDAESLLSQCGVTWIAPRLNLDMMLETDPEQSALDWLKTWK
ncbi:flavodoxin domain-containing protein [Aliidiomarina sp. Khilg15.8]